MAASTENTPITPVVPTAAPALSFVAACTGESVSWVKGMSVAASVAVAVSVTPVVASGSWQVVRLTQFCVEETLTVQAPLQNCIGQCSH